MQTLIMIERLSIESIQSKQGLGECDSTFLSDKSDLFARKMLTQTTQIANK